MQEARPGCRWPLPRPPGREVKVARLLTVLGLGKYEPVSYYVVADPARPYETAYAPVATAALAGPVADAAVLVTAEARAMHWEGCRDAFAGLGVPARAIDIPAGTTEDETWQVFTAILDAVDGEEEVVLDVTFSFRHLPFVLFASLTYLTALRRVKVRGIYYGAKEAGKGGRAPIVDLAPLLTLADWYHAVRTFADTGVSGHPIVSHRGRGY
jgi:CRISPR-associated DxTHG motif protein